MKGKKDLQSPRRKRQRPSRERTSSCEKAKKEKGELSPTNRRRKKGAGVRQDAEEKRGGTSLIELKYQGLQPDYSDS